MSKFIVITSIFEPTDAVRKFAEVSGFQMIVVGDKKTPSDWSCPNVSFLSIDAQLKVNSELVKVLPFNHYCRKMMGYLQAMNSGASLIVDTDDDNIPENNWEFPDLNAEYETVDEPSEFVNIYELFTEQKVWPRGYPLRKIGGSRSIRPKCLTKRSARIGVWQGLANGDPDVDAIYRLTSDESVSFRRAGPFALAPNTVCPFNSQNTGVVRELFPLLYLPAFVTFRFTDILRGLVAQPIMWAHGYQLGFLEATVRHERNPHDYMKDFESEVPMYLRGEEVIKIVADSLSESSSVTDHLREAYNALLSAGIVTKDEIVCLDAWLKDCEAATAVPR